MSELSVAVLTSDGKRVLFHCPGCQYSHAPSIEPGRWTWNGSLSRPTFHPSILVTCEYGDARTKHVCHSFVTDGKIQFLGDCTHALAGQTFDLPEYDWEGFSR